MAKRPAEEIAEGGVSLKSGERPVSANGQDEEFEDEFEDEFESEDEIIEAGVDGRPDEERIAEEKEAMEVDQRTFIPGRDKLQTGEILSPDSSAYDMFHTLSSTWPCLSFDFIPDSLGDNRRTYPATLYAVAGTQAESRRSKENEIMVMKLSGLSRMEKPRNDEDSDDDSDDDENTEPILETRSLPLSSTTNRICAHQFPPSSAANPPTTLVAVTLESASVEIYEITPHLRSFDHPGTTITPAQSRPIATFKSHRSEGYALAWSPLSPTGRLLSGDSDGKIFMHSQDNGKWSTDNRPFTGHQGSVEDLQWSPNERNVFASASSDGSVKIWDTRSKSRSAAVSVKVSETDVNVLSWSMQTPHLLATGADDGVWAVWDLRQWKPLSSIKTAGGGAGTSTKNDSTPEPVARYDFHKEQITSIEWHPSDDSIIAVAAGDNTITLWDLAVEFDDEESKDTADAKDVPPQLLFVHYMESAKECHWHPQITGCVMGTGSAGFGIFKTINV